MYYVIRFTKVRRRKSDNVPLKTQGRAGTRTVHAHGQDKQKAGSAAPGRVRVQTLYPIRTTRIRSRQRSRLSALRSRESRAGEVTFWYLVETRGAQTPVTDSLFRSKCACAPLSAPTIVRLYLARYEFAEAKSLIFIRPERQTLRAPWH